MNQHLFNHAFQFSDVLTFDLTDLIVKTFLIGGDLNLWLLKYCIIKHAI